MGAEPKAKQVLIIEDEAAVRFEMRELLEEEGYAVLEACNGREAMDVLNTGVEPAAVVLDLMMPEMDGWEFLEQLAREGRSLPVVVATAADTHGIPRHIPRVHKPNCVEPLLHFLEQKCQSPAATR